MIQAWALKFITSPWGRYIILGLTALSVIFGYLKVRDRRTERRAIREVHSEQIERGEAGKDTFHNQRREGAGRSVDALIDSLRGRDPDWERLRHLR